MTSRASLAGRVAMLLAAFGVTSPGTSRAEDAAGDVLARLASTRAAERLSALAALPRLVADDPRVGTRALAPLREILRTGGWAERAGVVRVLPRIAVPAAVALWLHRLDPAREEDERVLEAAVGASGDRAADAGFARTLVDLARDTAASVPRRALAAEALGGVLGLEIDAVLSSPLPGNDWIVESCRALALGRRGGRASIPPLLDLLGHADAAPRAHAWEGLTRITRQPFPATKAPWLAWWAAHEKEPLPPPSPLLPAGAAADRYRPADAAHVPRYYGIPLPRRGEESHVVFCVDTSQSMAGEGIEQARRELGATVKDLTTGHLFDVVAFHETVRPWAGRLVRAHPVAKARVLEWMRGLESISYTNLYDAVETAFEYAGRGRHPAAEPTRLDAVFVLSDGAPNRGRWHAPAQVVAGIAALSLRQVPVHTIGVGDQVFPLLRAIAEATGGVFVDAFE